MNRSPADQLSWLVAQGGAQNPLWFDPDQFCPTLTVPNKQGQNVQFNLWQHQRMLARATLDAWEMGKFGLVHVKPRQEGASAFICAVLTWYAMFVPGTQAAIISYKRDHTTAMARRCIQYWSSLPDWARPKRRAKAVNSLIFDEIRSQLLLTSAQSDEPLRGDTVQMMFADEISSWGKEGSDSAWTASRNAVPDEGGFIFAASTPKGYGDALHRLWQEADDPGSRWSKIFIPWTEIEEYRLEPPKGWKPAKEMYDYAQRYSLTAAQAFWAQTVALPKCVMDWGRFLSEYPPDEVTCWVQAGDATLPTEPLLKLLQGMERGRSQGDAELYEAFNPLHRYIITVDPASGYSKRDATGVLLIDSVSWEQVGEFRGNAEPHVMAQFIAQLAKKYGDAIVYVEANGVGEAIISHLRAMHGVRLYHRAKGQPGWWSSAKTKAEAVADAIELIADGSVTLRSARLVRQLMQYRGGWSKARDMEGGHYDLAHAFFLAAWVLKRYGQSHRLRVKPKGPTDYVVQYRRANGLTIPGSASNTPWGQHR
jgi:hypothetical protein